MKFMLFALLLFCTPVFANGWEPPKPKVITKTVEVEKVETRVEDYVLISGLATAAFKDTDHPILYGALAGLGYGALRKMDESGTEIDRVLIGVAIGSLGTGLIIGPHFIGWQVKW